MSRRFAVNAPAVVSEVIDGEAVIMNLQSGHYFSARDTGALVWAWLERGASEAEVAAALARRYGLVEPDARLVVASFVASLELHELVAEAERAAPGALDAEAAPADWSSPVLSVYTDMEDLLLLDPIHDVGAAGWPMPKADAEAA